jgi:hypothetical protein
MLGVAMPTNKLTDLTLFESSVQVDPLWQIIAEHINNADLLGGEGDLPPPSLQQSPVT